MFTIIKMFMSITLLHSALLPELHDAQLSETASFCVHLFNQFPVKDKTASAENNNSSLLYVNAEIRINHVNTCLLLACETGSYIHYTWHHDSRQIFEDVALNQLEESFQSLFSRSHST